MNPLAKAGIAARKLALRAGLGGGAWSANDTYVDQAPSTQQTVDVFKGDWASRLPVDGVVSGTAELFADSRIDWLVETLGGVKDLSVFELGPLEGGHSWMLEQAGAASVTAVEGNKAGYLKCLLVQKLLGMKRVDFVLGDFDRVLAATTERYDLLVASGVLYHLADPLATLQNMMRPAEAESMLWSRLSAVCEE